MMRWFGLILPLAGLSIAVAGDLKVKKDPFYRELYNGIQTCKKVDWDSKVIVPITEEAWDISKMSDIPGGPPNGGMWAWDKKTNIVQEVPRGYMSCDWVLNSAWMYAQGILEKQLGK